jgi:hypothetical protein|tara:strand:- start:338 stop:784 length:447 start_codon:yes stop_codon:yes gene_type:complete
MTMALCLNCGEIKIGALIPCSNCAQGPTEDKDLDILFTDWKFSVETLTEFGNVIKAISSTSDNDKLRFSAFLLYISNNHDEILEVNYDDKHTALCNSLLEKAKVRNNLSESGLEKYFDTFSEAISWAKENPGKIITRSSDDKGYITKK